MNPEGDPMTTTDRLDRIEARAQAATKGPWGWHPYGISGRTLATPGPVFDGVPTHELNILKTTDDWPPHDADAEFIAAARADMPALVAAVRAVLGRHRRDGRWGGGWCLHDGRPWPCPTAQAITDALGGERA